MNFVKLISFYLQVQKDKVKYGLSLSQGKKKIMFEAYKQSSPQEKDETCIFPHLNLSLE